MKNDAQSCMINVQLGIEMDKIKYTLWKMKTGKTRGIDNIAPEMMKHMEDFSIKMFYYLLSLTWKTKQIPEKWRLAIVISIHKRGDTTLSYCKGPPRSNRNLVQKIQTRLGLQSVRIEERQLR